jgi:hypothetical protein
MLLNKQEIVEMLRDNGDFGTAQQAEATLDDQIDTERDQELLIRHGINVDYLLRRREGQSPAV